MAPNFRQNTQTRRGNRSGYVEHDDFEGLPVRQWRQEWVKVAPPPPTDTTQKNDIWAIELPHGMPKDSHLLPPHTQELLRAARSGRLYKRPPPVEEEEADPDAALAEKPDKKEDDPSTKGYQVKVWKQVARNAEGPTISHLAKRRKGVITLSSNLPDGASSGPTIMKATVRRIDAAGNPYTQEITLHEGQPVDGEIISTTVVPAPNAVTNGDQPAAATPVRRRPPPPKRKPKGPGRGRKKKLPLPTSTRPEISNPGVEATPDSAKLSRLESDDIKPDDQSEAKNQDSEMADDDEGDDGEDDGEEGEDGDEGDEDDGEMPDGETGAGLQAEDEAKPDQILGNPPTAVRTEPSIEAAPKDIPSGVGPSFIKRPSSPSNAGPHPVQPYLQHISSHFEGSPLKNVVAATSPTELSPKLSSNNGETLSATTITEIRPSETSLNLVVTLADPAQTAPSEAGSEEASARIENPDLDVEMSDEPHREPIEATGQTVPGRGLLQSDDTAVEPLPAVDFSEGESASATRQSPPPLSAPEMTNTGEPAEEVAPDAFISVVSDQKAQTPDTAPMTSSDLPASTDIDAGVESATLESREENEAESPDLFSGLEAALNQQGVSKEVSPVAETKTT